MIYLLFFMCLSFNVLAFTDGGSYEDKPQKPFRQRAVVVPEPVVLVDRHVLGKVDYEADHSILIAKPREVVKESAPEIIVVQANPMATVHEEQVKITATIESDNEQAVNYPL